MRRAFWKLTMVCGLVLGCSDSQERDTDLAVVVLTDLEAPKEIDRIEVEVRRDGVETKQPTRSFQPVFDSAARTSSIQLFLVPSDLTKLGFQLVAKGYLSDQIVAEQHIHSSCVLHKRKQLPVFLRDPCGAFCPTVEVPIEALLDYNPNYKPQWPEVDAAVDSGEPLDSGASIDLGRRDVLDAALPDVGRDTPDVPITTDGSPDLDGPRGTGGAGGSSHVDGGGQDGGGAGGIVGGTGGTGGTSTPTVECPALDPPVNGSVDVSTRTPGSTAAYSCWAGYDLTGTSRRTCRADGTWSDAAIAANCDPVNCGAPSAPTVVTLTVTTTTFGSTATYACPPCQVPVSTTIRCEANRKWSGPAPDCTVAVCGQPPTVTNASPGESQATICGTNVTYSCTTGYTPSGGKPSVCQVDGTWSDPGLICSPVDCGPLSIENGTVDYYTDTKYPSKATYKCSPPYAPRGGTVERHCQASATWDGSPPTCEVNCGTAPKPQINGGVTLSDGTWKGSIGTFYCCTGYMLMPLDRVATKCLADGSWSVIAPPDCLCANPPCTACE